MGKQSLAHARALWNCGWCSILLLSRAAAVGVGNVGDVMSDVIGGDKDGVTVTVAATEGTNKVRGQRGHEEALPIRNATITKYSRKQKRPRWEFHLPPKRTFAYTAMPAHFKQDDGGNGDHFEDLIPAQEKVDMIVQGQGKLAAAGGHVDVGGGDKGIIVKLERQGPQNSRDHEIVLIGYDKRNKIIKMKYKDGVVTVKDKMGSLGDAGDAQSDKGEEKTFERAAMINAQLIDDLYLGADHGHDEADVKDESSEKPSEPTTIIAGSLGKILEIVQEQMSSIMAKGDDEPQQRSTNSNPRPVELQRPFIPGRSHKIGMGQRFKISPDIFYDIFPSQTEPMSPVQSWTEERRYAVEVEEERAPHEAPATLQKYPSLLMDGIEEGTRQGGRPGGRPSIRGAELETILRRSRDRARSLDGYKMQEPFVNDEILRQVSSDIGTERKAAKTIMKKKRTRLRKKKKKKVKKKKKKKKKKLKKVTKRSVDDDGLNGEVLEEMNEAEGEEGSESESGDDRSGRDLVYERMKMRSGNASDKEHDIPVGGGFLEKQLLKGIHATSDRDDSVAGHFEDATFSESKSKEEDFSSRGISAAADLDFVQASLRAESREMECCGDLQLVSNGGVALCHPYALGRFRKIGVCGGRSFYQHSNNSDIFLYHACAAWYVGLEIGACGGWMLAKSLDLCASSQNHQTPWQYYNNGHLERDDTFGIVELCHFNFESLMTQAPSNHLFHDAQQDDPFRQPRPQHFHQQQSVPQPQSVMLAPSSPSWSGTNGGKNQYDPQGMDDVTKHEHFHYHIKLDSEDGKSDGQHQQQQQQQQGGHHQKWAARHQTTTVTPGTLYEQQLVQNYNRGRPPQVQEQSQQSYAFPSPVAGEQQHILISKYNLRPAGTTTRPALTTPRHYLVPPPNQYEVSRFPFSATGRKQSPSSDLQRGDPRPTVTSLREQLYRHPLTAVSSSSGQPHAVGYIIRKRPSSSGSGLVSAGNGAPYDYDYDGFAGKENPASRSVNDGNDEQDLEYSEGDDADDAKADPSSGKLFYFPVVAENPNGDKVKYYKKLNRMDDQEDQDFTTAAEAQDKNSRRMSK